MLRKGYGEEFRDRLDNAQELQMDRLYGQGEGYGLIGQWSAKHFFTSVAGARKRLLRKATMRITLKELRPLNPTDSGPWDLHAREQRPQDDLTIRGR